MFLPLRDENPSGKFALVNIGLLVANIAVFFYQLTLTPHVFKAFVMANAMVPARVSGWVNGATTFEAAFLPLITSMFLHAGFAHILGNMLFLWIFGDNVEDRLGSGTYFVFYMLCGIVAAIGQGLVQPEPMVGASGAIAGVLGAYVVMFPAARVSTLVFLGIFITILQLPALIVIGFFIVLQVIDALAELRLTAHQATENIAYFAHLFGFVAGILLLLLFRQRREQGRFRFG